MATAIQKITLSSAQDIPFNKLVLSHPRQAPPLGREARSVSAVAGIGNGISQVRILSLEKCCA
jgi:hypothetical protein